MNLLKISFDYPYGSKCQLSQNLYKWNNSIALRPKWFFYEINCLGQSSDLYKLRLSNSTCCFIQNCILIVTVGLSLNT